MAREAGKSRVAIVFALCVLLGTVGHLSRPSAAGSRTPRWGHLIVTPIVITPPLECFWTALNFFNDEPDDRLLDPKYALDRLHQDYFLVQDELQLGDIVALSDQHLNIFHVAVYLADDLVFTKNGYFSLAPWTILPMDELKGHFADHANDWRVTYYRRKDQ